MSKYIRNWEDWDEIEDETSLEQTRNKRKNKLHKDPNTYTNEQVYNKVIEYYKYYYKPNTNDNG